MTAILGGFQASEVTGDDANVAGDCILCRSNLPVNIPTLTFERRG